MNEKRHHKFERGQGAVYGQKEREGKYDAIIL